MARTVNSEVVAAKRREILNAAEGRGMSGPLGSNYSIIKEDEDLDALLQKTGTHFIFGTADGALFALHAVISLPAIQKVVSYEPVLLFGQPGQKEFEGTIDRYNRDIASGNLVRTMVGLTKAEHADTGKIKALPDFLLEILFKLVLSSDARKVKDDELAYREFLPTLGPELQVVRSTNGTIEDYRAISAEVLLFVGGKSNAFLKSTSIELSKMLPHAHLVEIQDRAHGAAKTTANRTPSSTKSGVSCKRNKNALRRQHPRSLYEYHFLDGQQPRVTFCAVDEHRSALLVYGLSNLSLLT